MPAYLRIGELARRTGVSEPTLRAWERRYGLLRPERSSGGFRLYSDDDLARVSAMRGHLERGVGAAEAARLARAERRTAEQPPAAALADELVSALDAFADVEAQAALDRTFAVLTVEGALREVLLPVMSRLGDRWEDDDGVVAREHFATNLVRGRLLALARGWDVGAGPRALLACAPDEQHDIGLISLGLALRTHGWRITYLGQSTPFETLALAARVTQPELVAVSAARPEHLRDPNGVLRAVGAAFRLLVGGPGATERAARSVGAELLAGHPLDAASAVAGG